MKSYNLGLDEQRQYKFTLRKRLEAVTDLTQTANATAQTIPLFTARAGSFCRSVLMRLTIPFKASGDNTFNDTTVIVGDSGDTDRLFASTQINENGTEVLIAFHPSTVPCVYATDTVINAIFTPMTGKNLAALNVGAIDFFFDIVNVDRLIS